MFEFFRRYAYVQWGQTPRPPGLPTPTSFPAWLDAHLDTVRELLARPAVPVNR